MHLRSLSINDCEIETINKGFFNLMLNLIKLDLSRNKIESIGNDSFSVEPFESNLLELYLYKSLDREHYD